LVLARARRHRQVVDEPVVKRPVILELQRAERMRDALDRVGLAVGEIIARIDEPPGAGARMRGVQDAVEHRVAQIDVARGHVILARSTRAPFGNSPARMRRNRSRFSSTPRLRNGLSVPGSVNVPRAARISSWLWSSI